MPPLTPANNAIRAVNVTASEVGALLGEHPYQTPGMIFDRITRPDRLPWDEPAKPPSLSMRFGSAAEPILQDLAEDRLGIKLRMNSRTFVHRRVPLCATPDAIVLAPDLIGQLVLYGRALVEFKLSFSQNRWRDGLPPDIEWQARAQLACTRRDRVIVYVFHGSETIYVVERHRGKERRLTQAVEKFWKDHIETGIRPDDPVRVPSFVA